MSHFTVLVTKTQDKPVDEQLAPFDENREVPSYDRECWCIGNIARRAGGDKAEAELDTNTDQIRDAYWKLPEVERTDEKWLSLIKPISELSDKYEKEHELYQKPNPDCEECHGSGTYKSQYNPDSKWDWYSVGGRWAGYFKLKPGATGELGEPGVFDNKPEHDADIATVEDIDWANMEHPTTYAVLHDGVWHQHGEMGWFGMASNEKPKDAWQAEFDAIIKGLDPEDEVTVVDCHI
jgi:hypothetical protein